MGDEVNLEVRAGGTITITPLRKEPLAEEISTTIRGTMKDYAPTMRRLAWARNPAATSIISR
jgi:antitoxin component of MazEF toxin-antitoxin module